MCSGGGSSATITMPDYSAYNNEFQLQKSAIEQTMNNGTQMLQQQLTASLRNKEAAYGQLTDQARLQAENTNAQAMRLATLIGAPPPEKSAEAPRGAKSQSTSSISRTCKICKVVIFVPSSRIHVNGSHSVLICCWLTRVGICAIILVVCRICFVAQPGL